MTPTTLKSALLSAALLGTAPAQTSTPTDATQPTPEQARQLIERLTGGGQSGVETQVTYGAVPPALKLRLSDAFTVSGTLRTNYNGGQSVNYRVIVNSSLSGAEARERLEDDLIATGWISQGAGGQPTGFAPVQGFANYFREGTAGQGNYVLNATFTEENGQTALVVDIGVISAEQLRAVRRNPAFQARSSLPVLQPMPGVKVRPGMTPTYPNGAISSAWVQTNDRSANQVFSFYSAQLKSAGWKALTDTTTGTLRAVTYALTDLNGREALGTLGIRPWEKGGGYVLTVSVQGFKP